jgi:hypothetical protein
MKTSLNNAPWHTKRLTYSQGLGLITFCTDFKYYFYKQNGKVVLSEISVSCKDEEMCLKIPRTARLLSTERCLYFGVFGIAQWAQGRATAWIAGVRFPAGRRGISLLRSVQTGSGVHPASIQSRGQEWWSYNFTPPYVFMAQRQLYLHLTLENEFFIAKKLLYPALSRYNWEVCYTIRLYCILDLNLSDRIVRKLINPLHS